MKRPEVTIEDFKKQAAEEGWNPTPQTLELVGYLIDAMERAYNHGYADGLADGGNEMKYPLLITIDEMLSLGGFATMSELKLCWEMYEKYFQAKNLNPRSQFDASCFFAFVFMSGRIQGIREERLKNKSSQNPARYTGSNNN